MRILRSRAWRGWQIAGLWVVLVGCSSKSSIPPNDSAVNIQASTTATSDVKFIEIIVHQLSDGSLVYDSGLQPSSDFQDTRQHLEETVALEGATDFLFDAKAFDVNQNLLKNGNQVQEATQPAGVSTTVLIVIDLNAGDTGVVSPADITAVTDNIPVLYPPTLTQSGTAFTLNYKASDIDLDADAGTPIDSNETLTFFSSVLAGNVDISSNTDPGLFTEGQAFTFTFNDDQPVKILSAVVDRLNQLTFAITIIDPTTGAFQTVEYGEGYALFNDNTIVPSPKKGHHDRSTGSVPQPDPTGPHSGPIATVVLKHGTPPSGPQTSIPPPYAVEAITRSDGSLVVTPNNVAYWDHGIVQSFNRYEEQPDSSGNIVIDYKLRVQIPTPPDTVLAPAGDFTIDTMKFTPTGASFVAGPDLQEAHAVIPMPSIGSITDGEGGTSFTPGGPLVVTGSDFLGGIPSQPEIDDRQIYLQLGTTYIYPEKLGSSDYENDFHFLIPTDIATGIYDLVVCSFGRICTDVSGAITVTSNVRPPPASSEPYIEFELSHDVPAYQSYPSWINDSGTIVGESFPSADNFPYNAQAVIWSSNGQEQALQQPDGVTETVGYYITPAGVIVGAATFDGGDTSSTIPLVWPSADSAPTELPAYDGLPFNIAVGTNSSGYVVGYSQDSDPSTSTLAIVWDPSGNPSALFFGNGVTSAATEITESGAVLGEVTDASGNVFGAVWPSVNESPALLPLGATAAWMNNNGVIVGCLNGLPYTWLSPTDSGTPLPLPDDATEGCAAAITDNGLISGNTDEGLVLWTPDGNGGWTIQFLPHQVTSGSQVAGAVNSFGEVVGWDIFNDPGNADNFAAKWLPATPDVTIIVPDPPATEYFDLVIHQASDGTSVYNSGPILVQADGNGHYVLQLTVSLAGGTDFFLDSNAYDSSKTLIASAPTTDYTSPSAGGTLTVLIEE